MTRRILLLNEYSYKGIGTEAVRQVCSIAFKILSLEHITANVFQPNIASISVLTHIFIQGNFKRRIPTISWYSLIFNCLTLKKAVFDDMECQN